MSSYVVSKHQGMYGGKQEDFLLQSSKIVEQAAENYKKVVAAKQDLVALFHDTLKLFEEKRQKIAIEHETKEANTFGIRRDKSFRQICCMTPLSDPYHEYNARILPFIQKCLKAMKHTKRAFQEFTKSFEGEKYLDRRFCVDAAVYSNEYASNWLIGNTSKDYKVLCELTGVKAGEYSPEAYAKIIEDQDAMLRLKAKSVDHYKKLKISLAIPFLYETYKGKKSDYVTLTFRMEINGKMYALSQFLTWFYRAQEIDDPVGHMTGRSVVAVVHQDPFLIKPMLDEIAKIFKKAIEWDGKNLKELIDTVAFLEYHFAHCMPHDRGSGAIAEWIERSIFWYHGYKLIYNQKKMVSFEAYVSSPKEFVTNYPTMFDLTKIEPQKE